MKKTLLRAFTWAALLAIFAPCALAGIFLDEGFKTGSGAGYYSTTDKTSLSYNQEATYTQSTGFAVDKWQGTTSVIVSRTSGLSFPASFSDQMDEEGAGAIGYRGESAAVNWSGSGVNQSDLYRNQYRKIVPLNGTAGEKRYFRALMYADSTALGQLSTADNWLSWRNGYSLGIAAVPATPPSGYSGYNTSIMQCLRYMHFSLYRNKNENKYEMAFTVKGTEGTAKRVTLGNVTAGHTYLVVAEITLGDGPEQLRAFAYDCTTDAGLNPDNLPWVAADSSVTYTLIDGTDDLSLFLGGQYKTTGTVKFDEIRIATELNEVLPVADAYVSVSAAPAANLTTTSADLPATVGMKGVASATPSLAWGLAADALAHTNTLSVVSASGPVTNSLSGLSPMTTYYYQWTVSAVGVDPAASAVGSFTTKGDVVFGDVTAGGLPSTGGVWAAVDVEETGLAATDVTCYCGETAGAMTALQTWPNVQSGDALIATNTAAAWGKTYLFKFVSSFEYGGETYTTETPVASRQTVALDHLRTTASGDWMDGANWSLGTPPSDIIAATISNVTSMASLYLDDAAATVKSLSVKNGQATVDLRGSSSMSIGSISFGDTSIQNCNNGVFATTGGVITVKGGIAPAYGARTSYNRLELNGTQMTVGSISTETRNDSGAYNSITVNPRSVLTITNGLTISYAGTMTVDAATVTNKKNLVVAQLSKPGTLIIRNGAYFRQPWASTVGVGGKGEGVLNVLSGSTFDASGAAFYLGSDGDGGSTPGTLLISNSTFRTASFVSPKLTTYTGAYTTTVGGPDALFAATGDVTLGAVTKSAGSNRTSGSTRMNVAGGTVSVRGTLHVGGGDNDRAMNYLTVSCRTAAMELGNLNCRTNSTVKFAIPERGFDGSRVVHASGGITLAGAMPPIQIDATGCRSCAKVSLLEADGGITGLTEENLDSRVVFVEREGRRTLSGRDIKLRLVTDDSGETPRVLALQLQIGEPGTFILVQ